MYIDICIQVVRTNLTSMLCGADTSKLLSGSDRNDERRRARVRRECTPSSQQFSWPPIRFVLEFCTVLHADQGSDSPEQAGWRDIPLGAANADPYRDRCEVMTPGPNFGELGVPIPPNSIWHGDRYTVECERERKQCTSAHRSSRDGCDGDNNYFLSLRLNFFLDCDEYNVGGLCKASANYNLAGRPGFDKRFCNRGLNDPEGDPPHGFHWSIPLCRTDPECLAAGAAVLSDPDSLEVFQRDCCMLQTATEVEAGPDGSTTMRQLCERLTSGAARTATSWLRIVVAALAASIIHSHALR